MGVVSLLEALLNRADPAGGPERIEAAELAAVREFDAQLAPVPRLPAAPRRASPFDPHTDQASFPWPQ